jgi:hypothetical protein
VEHFLDKPSLEELPQLHSDCPTVGVLDRQLLTVKIRQPNHEFTFGVGMTFVSY